jgi:hypothetical protein
MASVTVPFIALQQICSACIWIDRTFRGAANDALLSMIDP